MADLTRSRKYDIVLLGATGYTGRLTSEYVSQHLPTNLKWAIAGRSKTKLDALAATLYVLNPKRSQPAMEIVSIEDNEQLDIVIKATKVCISIVSYRKVGDFVIDSCIRNKTDYVDAVGDTVMSRRWISKFHEPAKKAGVAIIHGCAYTSAPQDLMSWAAARELRQKAQLKTKEVIFSVVQTDLSPSGGSFDAIFTSMEDDPDEKKEGQKPWVLSPVEGEAYSPCTNALQLRRDSDLGLLSAATLMGPINRALVHRTWGLLQDTKESYGPKFRFNEYQNVSSTAAGVMQLLSSMLFGIILSVSFLRNMLKRVVPAPGEGPDVEKTKNSPFKFELIAIADEDENGDGTAPRAYAVFEYPSDSYHATGMLCSQGAASLLYRRTFSENISGGILTPAILGDDLVERIQKAGVKFEVKLL